MRVETLLTSSVVTPISITEILSPDPVGGIPPGRLAKSMRVTKQRLEMLPPLLG